MIDEKNQIEEMAKVIASMPIGTIKPDLTLTEMGELYKGEFILKIARHLYNEGYRKQKVGEWVYREDEFGNAYYACPICDCQTRHKENYCSSCGAIMKGEKKDG